MKKYAGWAVLLVGFLLSSQSMADAKDLIREQLRNADSRIPIKSIEAAPLEGMYEVLLESGELLYAHEQGEYFFVGHLFRIDDQQGLVNVTEQSQNQMRVAALAEVTQDQMITYPARGEKQATLRVFTDVDCPYCRQLHEEVEALNEMGVEVSYLAFPRGGPNTATYRTMVTVWCGETAEERAALLDRVKSGGTIENKTCENPVVDQFMLGQKIGVTGTPAMVLEDGTLIPGYMPAERIAQMLGVSQ